MDGSESQKGINGSKWNRAICKRRAASQTQNWVAETVAGHSKWMPMIGKQKAQLNAKIEPLFPTSKPVYITRGAPSLASAPFKLLFALLLASLLPY
jgi:hypothetical protein